MQSMELLRVSGAALGRTGLIAGAAVVLALIGNDSQAADDKIFQGAGCQFLEDDNAGQTRYNGTFRNTSGATRWVICPVAIDLPSTSNMERIIVSADANVDEDTCFAEAAPEDGSAKSVWTHTDVIVAQGSVNYTRFWPTAASWADGPNWATWHIACQLPNNAAIYNVYVEER